MKVIIFVFANCLYWFCYGQCSKVQYLQIRNYDWGTYQDEYLLTFDSEASIYLEVNIKTSKEKITESTVDSDGYSSGTLNIEAERKNLIPQYYYNSDKGFFFRENCYDELLTVKEDPYNLDWMLIDEYKEIGRFKCQRAEVSFRGRHYIAWFTRDIPTLFGPWKFHGLPGLILDIKDESGLFRIVARSVNLNTKSQCSVSIKDENLTNPLSLNKYLDEKRRLKEEDFAKISARFLKKGAPPMKIDDDCEECNASKIEYFNRKN